MIPYLGCESAREMLEAFVDGELSVDDQVAVESHLRWCRTCADRVEDLSLIGSVVRIGTPAVRPRIDDAQAIAAIQAGVLTRIRAERDQSFPARLREMFSDRRLVWPAIGATAAVLVCLSGAFAVMHSATAEHPDSLAAMIAVAQPIGQQLRPSPYVVPGGLGSDENPMGLADAMLAPRMTSDAVALESSDEEMFAVAAVVDRQGRVAISDFVGPQVRRHKRSARDVEDVAAVLDALNQSRFAPAQGQGGRRVAVSTVLLFTRTTAVRDAHLDRLLNGVNRPRRAERVEPAPVVPASNEPPAAPAAPSGEGEQSGSGNPASTTA